MKNRNPWIISDQEDSISDQEDFILVSFLIKKISFWINFDPMVSLCHNKIFFECRLNGNFQGSSVLHVPSIATHFFASIKGASVGMNCPKKFDLRRSRQVGQMGKDEYEKKNPTYLFCGLFQEFCSK